jgi:hypothetical protein
LDTSRLAHEVTHVDSRVSAARTLVFSSAMACMAAGDSPIAFRCSHPLLLPRGTDTKPNIAKKASPLKTTRRPMRNITTQRYSSRRIGPKLTRAVARSGSLPVCGPRTPCWPYPPCQFDRMRQRPVRRQVVGAWLDLVVANGLVTPTMAHGIWARSSVEPR